MSHPFRSLARSAFRNGPVARAMAAFVFAFAFGFIIGCGGSSGSSPAPVPPPLPSPTASPTPPPTGRAPYRQYRVVASYPHQTDAFTQGLEYRNGLFYESTGLVGQSELREVDPPTGAVLRSVDLPSSAFGEGLTFRGDQIYQLTLNSAEAYVWDRESFALQQTLNCPVPAWGLEWDGELFWMSDGSDRLSLLDPDTLAVVGSRAVTDGGAGVPLLNELEFVGGLLWANLFTTSEIVAIDPGTGRVVYRLDLEGIIDAQALGLTGNDVLNGIAYDEATGRIFITGKRWPTLFEIELLP